MFSFGFSYPQFSREVWILTQVRAVVREDLPIEGEREKRYCNRNGMFSDMFPDSKPSTQGP